MKNNGVKNEHKINTYRRTDQLWLFPSLHFMIFVMPAMFGSIFLMAGYIAVMFLEQIGTAIICTALMFRHLFAMSGRREAVIIGVFHRLPSVLSMPFPRFGVAGEGKGSGGNCKPDHEKNCMVFDSPHLRLFLISVRPEGCCLPPVVLLTEYPACPFCYFPEFSS